MNAGYGSHAELLASRCARGCERVAPCISSKDGQRICAVCAKQEEVADATV